MLNAHTIQIQSLKSGLWEGFCCDVLRADALHPVVSGNKWFKLKHYLHDARVKHYDTIATFGGAYSNHIVATAFAGKQAGLHTVGIIRGEKPPQLSHTLLEAESYGMELVFVDRGLYRDKSAVRLGFAGKHWYWVEEGGYGFLGMEGVKDMLADVNLASYSHIICACGTGTTLAGLVAGTGPDQHCVGIPVLKGHVNLERDVMELLGEAHPKKAFTVLHGYHFGGYAKHPAELIEWMNLLWLAEGVATDIVYTGKLMYAVRDLIIKGYFDRADRLLVIHSGGLQGNRSLPKGRLAFL